MLALRFECIAGHVGSAPRRRPGVGVLQFEFSRGVVLPESTNVWVETQFIEFMPHIEGKFVWQDSSKLVFSPDVPFAGDTKFKGKFNTDLLKKLSHSRSFKGDEEFSFRPSRLR